LSTQWEKSANEVNKEIIIASDMLTIGEYAQMRGNASNAKE
jgi:hypothetical protein